MRLLPPSTPLCDTRGLVRGRGKPRVAPSARTTPRYDDTLPSRRQVGQERRIPLGVLPAHLRATRHPNHQALSPPTVPIRTLAMLTVTRRPLVATSHLHQRAHRGVSQHHNTASGAAITTIRSSQRNELLAAKGHDAVSPRTCFDQDLDVIDHCFSLNGHHTHVYQVLGE